MIWLVLGAALLAAVLVFCLTGPGAGKNA